MPNRIESATFWTALALAGVLIGGVLRFADLDRFTLWSDELASHRRSTTLGAFEHIEALRGNHPFYEVVLLRSWTALATGDAGIRVPSAVAGTLTLAVMWAVGLAYDRRAAALAVWFLALSPLHLMFSRIARPYALATLWAALGMWALVYAARRPRPLAFAGYGLSSSLLVLTNLFAGALCAGQAAFLVWFHRKRPRRLAPWVVCGAALCLVVGPWLLTYGRAAVRWGMETPYAAAQAGPVLKALYFPFVFALGETVYPFDLRLVIPAALGFGLCAAAGVWKARKSRLILLCLLSLLAVYAVGLVFRASSPKHMMVASPAFALLVVSGGLALRPRWLGAVALGLCLATRVVSVGNYFAGKDFHDADMVTPWREIVATVEAGELPGDKLVIGYLADPDVYRMFRRYYRGDLDIVWLDEAGPPREPEQWLGEGRTWLLLHHTDPRDEVIERVRETAEIVEVVPFQRVAHTLRGLQEGLSRVGEFESYLYKLYLIEEGG